jgi:hypothetical protein
VLLVPNALAQNDAAEDSSIAPAVAVVVAEKTVVVEMAETVDVEMVVDVVVDNVLVEMAAVVDVQMIVDVEMAVDAEQAVAVEMVVEMAVDSALPEMAVDDEMAVVEKAAAMAVQLAAYAIHERTHVVETIQNLSEPQEAYCRENNFWPMHEDVDETQHDLPTDPLAGHVAMTAHAGNVFGVGVVVVLHWCIQGLQLYHASARHLCVDLKVRQVDAGPQQALAPNVAAALTKCHHTALEVFAVVELAECAMAAAAECWEAV